MRRCCLFAFFSIAVLCRCFAQIDTEFWFAPPEITFGHGDRPLYLRIASQDQAARVQVIMPARGNQVLADFILPPATAKSVTLSLVSDIETNIPDSVLSTGIHIVSSAAITAYYEEASSLNGEIFTLKGKNGLGNKFLIPWQNVYDNDGLYSPTPYGSFDIVATSDNTVVTVIPTAPIVGHENETEIIIKLNAGQTYSFKKLSLSAVNNPFGTRVTSTKPIAITLKDDSVIKNTCRDVIGDQLIPIEVTGKEYIVPKGFLNTPEYLFVMATEDNTEVYLSGISAPVSRLNKGKMYRLEMTLPSIYIRATKNVYVVHISGFGCEVGMAVMPPITCTGSKRVIFTRSSDEFFGMNILSKKEGIFYFKITNKGVSKDISADKFIEVPGTNGAWYSAQVSFSDTEVPVEEATTISNDHVSFQAGTINGDAGTTCLYGYFSSYSTLYIGDDLSICEGQTATLDAGPGKETYAWNTGATTQSIQVSVAGDYWVTVTREDCILSDTIRVDIRKGVEDLGPDVELCEGDTTHIDGKSNFSWQWSDGTKDRHLRTKDPGKYWVSVFDNYGCPASDTIQVIRYLGIVDDIVDLRLNYVTVDTAVQETIRLRWTILYPEKIPESTVTVYKRVAGDQAWNLVSMFADDVTTYTDLGNGTSANIYEYYVSLADQCGDEKRTSLAHNTILLTGVSDSVNDIINLQWNRYREWQSGVERYEVWRKLDKINSYVFVSSVDGSENTFSSTIAADGFKHQYIIRAMEKLGESESWSNPVIFELEHAVTVPNVFTPNGDAYNQYFFIPKIELYTESALTVVDRWGKVVFDTQGYKNNWDGDGLSSGVYYYTLNLHRNNSVLKGIVNIIK